MAKANKGDKVLLEIDIAGEPGRAKDTHRAMDGWFKKQNWDGVSLQVIPKKRKILVYGNPSISAMRDVVNAIKEHSGAYKGVSFGEEYELPKAGNHHYPGEGVDLSHHHDELVQRVKQLETEVGRLEEEKTSITHENVSRAQYAERLEGHLEEERGKAAEASRLREEAEAEALRATEENTKLKADLDKVSSIAKISKESDGKVSMDDLCVELMKVAFVPGVKRASEKYKQALEKLDINPKDIDDALTLTSVPLADNPEYKDVVKQVEKAKADVSAAKAFAKQHGMVAIDTSQAEAVIEKERRMRDAYSAAERILMHAKSSFVEQKTPCLVTTEKTKKSTNIHFVLPIESGRKSYGALENEMMGHLKEVLGYYFKTKKVGRYRSGERNGLVQYTFTTASKEPEKVKEEIIQALFAAQSNCLFSRIGCRMDITSVGDTSGWNLEKAVQLPQPAATAERPSKVGSGKKKPLTLGFRTGGVPDTYVALAEMALGKGIRIPSPKKFLKRMDKKPLEVYAAIMMAAKSNKYLTQEEIAKRAGKILEEAGIEGGMPAKPWTYFDNLYRSHILLIGEKQGRSFTYLLSRNFIPRSAGKAGKATIDDTVKGAPANGNGSKSLGFRTTGIPENYVKAARKALDRGVRAPNPRKFLEKVHDGSEFYVAIMAACSDGYCTIDEIAEKGAKFLKKAGLNNSEMPQSVKKVVRRLYDYGMLITGEKRGKKFTYTLSKSLKCK